MKLYSALIFREWKTIRRDLIFRLILAVLSAVCFSIPIFMGIFDEDMLPAPAHSELSVIYFEIHSNLWIFFAFIAFVFGYCAAANNGRYKADTAAGWTRYSIALPVTPVQNILASILCKWMQILFYAAFTAVLAVILGNRIECSLTVLMLNIYLLSVMFHVIISEGGEMIRMLRNSGTGIFPRAVILILILTAIPVAACVIAGFTIPEQKDFAYWLCDFPHTVLIGAIAAAAQYAVIFLFKKDALSRRE